MIVSLPATFDEVTSTPVHEYEARFLSGMIILPVLRLQHQDQPNETATSRLQLVLPTALVVHHLRIGRLLRLMDTGGPYDWSVPCVMGRSWGTPPGCLMDTSSGSGCQCLVPWIVYGLVLWFIRTYSRICDSQSSQRCNNS